MSPQQQLQRLLADIPSYEAADLISLLPLSAALQSAIYARILVLHSAQRQTAALAAALPDTDYLLSLDQVAIRIGKSTRWIRDNIESLPFARRAGHEHRFSARGLDAWIHNQPLTKMPTPRPPEKEAT